MCNLGIRYKDELRRLEKNGRRRILSGVVKTNLSANCIVLYVLLTIHKGTKSYLYDRYKYSKKTCRAKGHAKKQKSSRADHKYYTGIQKVTVRLYTELCA